MGGGGKSSKQTVGYKNYAGASLVLAKLIHRLLRVKIGDETAWTGSITSGVISINQPKLYGASGTEGGFVGDINFQPGGAAQMPDAYLISKLGSKISANRGASQLVFHQTYWGNNPYLKDIEVLAERVDVLDDGSTQWYPEKAPIQNTVFSIPDSYSDWKYLIVPYTDATDYHATDDSGWFVGSAPFGNFNYTGTPPTYPHDFGFNDKPQTNVNVNQVLWLHAKFNVSEISETMELEVYIDNGLDMWLNGTKVVSNLVPSSFHATVSLPGTAFVKGLNTLAFRCFDTLPTETATTNRAYFDLRVIDQASSTKDLNAAHILRECLTNKLWGYGYDDDDIDDDNFRGAADALYAEGFGLSYVWDDDSVQLEDLFQKVQDHIDGACLVDRTSLKWVIKLVRDTYNPDTLLELREDYEVISISDYARPDFLDLTNSVTVQFYDNANSTNKSVTQSNAALRLQQGVRINITKNYDMICNPTLAGRVLQRELNTASNPLSSCSVTSTSIARDLQRGDVFKLTAASRNYNKTIMRVTEVNRGNGTTTKVKIKCVEDRFALPQVAFINPQPPQWVDPGGNPSPVTKRMVIEVPYVSLIQTNGQANVDNTLLTSPDIGYAGVAGARVDSSLNADINVDSGAGYDDVAKLDWCPYGALTANIGALDATFTVANMSDFDELGTSGYLQIGNEILWFAAMNTTTGVATGVKRGVMDTLPETHLAGANVLFFEDYLDGPVTEYANAEAINVKLLTNASNGQLTLAAAPTDALTFVGRAFRPYAPGNLKINGGTVYGPMVSTSVTTIVFTWAHRSRTLQADQPVGHTEADVGPETGQTYTLTLYKGAHVLVQTDTGITANTFTYTGLSPGIYSMELKSVRVAHDSFSHYTVSFEILGGYYQTEDATGLYMTEDGTGYYLQG